MFVSVLKALTERYESQEIGIYILWVVKVRSGFGDKGEVIKRWWRILNEV